MFCFWTADTTSLGVSFRVLPQVFRADTAFENLYQAPDGRFYRVAGAIVAVFDESVYRPSSSGLVPVIPANTVFHIGRPDFLTHSDRPHDGDLRAEASASVTGAAPRDTARGGGREPIRVEAVRLAEPIVVQPIGRPVAESGSIRPRAGEAGVRSASASAGRAAPPARLLDTTVSNEELRPDRLRAIAARHR